MLSNINIECLKTPHPFLHLQAKYCFFTEKKTLFLNNLWNWNKDRIFSLEICFSVLVEANQLPAELQTYVRISP